MKAYAIISVEDNEVVLASVRLAGFRTDMLLVFDVKWKAEQELGERDYKDERTVPINITIDAA